jgi:hypothetical protein
MNKYTHVKESTKPLLKKQQRGLDRRTITNHKTVERMFGHFFPLFGSSLGVSYDGVNGYIIKVDRAPSVL